MREKIPVILIIVIAILVVANLVTLDIGWLRQQRENKSIKTEVGSELIPTPIPSIIPAASDSCGPVCQKTIEQKIAGLAATLSAKQGVTETKIIEKSVSRQNLSQPQTIYIPLGGGGITVKKEWADVGNAAVYFDLKDYPNFSEARFEGFIKVLNGNGKVYARLYDATHSIGVQGSDIEASGENFVLVSSDKLNFWQGKNLYRIQIKSLNGYEAAIDSGRIKLILK